MSAATVITVGAISPSSVCDTADALDVDVTVRFSDGTEVEGELTLLPAADGSGYTSWGEPGHWVEGRLLDVIQRQDDAEEILHDLAVEAGAACDDYADTSAANPWTYEGWWNTVLGGGRDALRVIEEFGLDPRDRRGLDEWLGQAAAEAWSEGGDERPMPSEWSEHQAQAIDELQASVEGMMLVETMPGHLRGSHRAAGNWGSYPHNGAERHWVDADEADEAVAADPDGYARIVRR